jgi:hypothetical protein
VSNAKEIRCRELSLIHQGRIQLRLRVGDFQKIVGETTGYTDVTGLDQAGRKAVLEHLQALGFTPEGSDENKFDLPPGNKENNFHKKPPE